MNTPKNIRRQRAAITVTIHAYILASLMLVGLTIFVVIKHFENPLVVPWPAVAFFSVLTALSFLCLQETIREDERMRKIEIEEKCDPLAE